MLRLISAVLHREPGRAVTDAALDLRPAELGIVVPLLAILLVLSAWPAPITDRSFAGSQAVTTLREALPWSASPPPPRPPAPKPSRRSGRRCRDRHARPPTDRLVRALAGARAARRRRAQPALRGLRPARRPARRHVGHLRARLRRSARRRGDALRPQPPPRGRGRRRDPARPPRR